MQELAGALDEVEASPAQVLVVTGAGTRVFVAGGDLKELAAIRTHEDAATMAETMRGVLDRLATLASPGGGCGERRCLRRRRRGGGGVRHPHRRRRRAVRVQPGGARDHAGVGRHRAAHRTASGADARLALMTTGRVLDAEAALALGLFDEVVPRARVRRSTGAMSPRRSRARRATPSSASRPRNGPPSPPRTPTSPTTRSRPSRTTWVADDHWRMVEEADQRRRAARDRS